MRGAFRHADDIHSTGLLFMLLPGTFLGVWNLLSISKLQAAEAISPGWIQAHGYAQIFGWAGTFLLGIGFYSIPKLRKMKPFSLCRAWVCWVAWTVGLQLRWSVAICALAPADFVAGRRAA